MSDLINKRQELAKNSPKVENGSGDSIYRQATIDAIKKSRFLVDAMEKVIRLPSAQPEREEDEDIPMEYFENGGI